MEQPLFKSYRGIPQQPDEKFDVECEESDRSSIIWLKDTRQFWSSRGLGLLTGLALLNVVLFLASAAFFFCASLQSSDNEARGARSAIGKLVNEYHPHRYELRHTTPYRGPPSPSVDKAWSDLVEDTLMIVPDEDLHGQNFSSRSAFRSWTDKYEGVVAKFEGFHALHCVNLLWKHTWPEYYTEEQAEMQRNPRKTHYHVDHCADLLRQSIQCNMDFSMLTFYKKGGAIYSDFNVLHQCQNFDASVAYMRDHRWDPNEQGGSGPEDGDGDGALSTS